jgi:hypothetical protein
MFEGERREDGKPLSIESLISQSRKTASGTFEAHLSLR